MSLSLTRIFSDVHYGDRASSLTSLSGLLPLFDGASDIVMNGDTLDTRPSTTPEATLALKAQVAEFFQRHRPSAHFLTGNHDPDYSTQHAVALAGGRVFVTHGDILFDSLVPWSRDAPVLHERVQRELARLPAAERERFETRIRAFRRAAASISQRHQSEKNGLKYTLGYLADTVWPPLRILKVLRAWREAPERASDLLEANQLPAQFFVMGHTHRIGAVRTKRGVVVLNTGSFCPPSGAAVVDVTADRILLRKIERKRSEFRLGPALADFALAAD